MLELKKAVSLESLRLPFRAALEAAAGIGAQAVEINARTMLRPQELSRTGVRQIRKWLDDFRLKVAAISYPTRRSLGDPNDLDRRLDGIRAAMAMANDLGCRVVSNQMGRIPDEDDQRGTLVAALSDLSSHSLKIGAWLAVRTGPDAGPRLEELLKQLPHEAVGVDFDPAELILYGHSPTEAMQALAARVTHFRARDGVRDLSLGRGVEVQLGRGTVDFPHLLALLEEQGYQGFLTVERRETSGNALGECAQALEFLGNLFA